MRKSAKRFLSTILAMALLCSCMVVMNVSTVLAADTYTFTPGTDLFTTDTDGTTSIIASGTTLEFTGGSAYITATTGPKASEISIDTTNYSDFSDLEAVIPIRYGSTISSTLSDFTTEVVNSNVYYTYIILKPTVDGTFTADAGIDASGTSTRRFRIWDNTNAKTVATMEITGGTGKKVYNFGEAPISDVTYSGDNVDSTTGVVTLEAGNTYIFYCPGASGNLGKMTFTPASTDPEISLAIDNDTIAVGSTATLTVDGEEADTDSVEITVYEVSVDDGEALTATAPSSYDNTYTTITTNDDGSVTYKYDFSAFAGDVIEEGFIDNDSNYNFSLSNGAVAASSSNKTTLDGDYFYNLSTNVI